MSNFATCTVPELQYKQALLQNQPVNLDLCYTFKKDKSLSYTDIKANDKPTIKFFIADGRGTTVTWAYKDQETRDLDFENLLKKVGK